MPSISLQSADIHYGVSGQGEPLLLIPGLGLDRNYYRLGIPELSKHMTVYAVDPRGIGESTKSPPPYTVEAWAEDFALLIPALGCGPTSTRDRSGSTGMQWPPRPGPGRNFMKP